MSSLSDRPSQLLLLSKTPVSFTYKSVDAVYRVPLTAILKELAFATRNSKTGTLLDIALPATFLFHHFDQPRSRLYDVTQRLVANVYKLICVIASKESINVENDDGIDVRIILLAISSDFQNEPAVSFAFGPVTTTRQLAACQRPWRSITIVEGEDGESLLRQFLIHRDSHIRVRRVPAGHAQSDGNEKDEMSEGTSIAVRHSSIAVGGTWDHIHIGHKLLLTMFAFMLEPCEGALTIGITGDELLVNKKYADSLQDWDQRKDSTVSFLQAIMDFRTPPAEPVQLKALSQPGPNGHAVHVALGHQLTLKCVRISDPFGPTITDKAITALVLSGETRSGGQAVNQKRSEKGWPELEVFEVDVIDAEDVGSTTSMNPASQTFESKLSSTSIRKALSENASIKSKA